MLPKSGPSISTEILEGEVMRQLVSSRRTERMDRFIHFNSIVAYVHSVMDVQSNLHLRTNSKVSRVIFEGNKAVGVAYVHAKNRAHKGELRETIVCVQSCMRILTLTLTPTPTLSFEGEGEEMRRY